MITAGKVSETLVLDGIKWGMGILLVLLYGSVHSQLEQYNPIIIYMSLILYILLFLADFILLTGIKKKPISSLNYSYI